MVLFGQGGSNPAMWFLFGRKWLYSDKVVAVGQNRLYSGKQVVLGQSGYIREKVVVFWQKWLYSGKSGCIRPM